MATPRRTEKSRRRDDLVRRQRRIRHHDLRSESGGIARDRRTTSQRSRQGSKTTAGRKRAQRERAGLDGQNDGVRPRAEQNSVADSVAGPAQKKRLGNSSLLSR